MTDPTNDNDAGEYGPDAHGQAALLLVESLLHELVARSVISLATAVEIVTVATDVKIDTGEEAGDSITTLRHSLTLLEAIKGSLSRDLPAGGAG